MGLIRFASSQTVCEVICCTRLVESQLPVGARELISLADGGEKEHQLLPVTCLPSVLLLSIFPQTVYC